MTIVIAIAALLYGVLITLIHRRKVAALKVAHYKAIDKQSLAAWDRGWEDGLEEGRKEARLRRITPTTD